MISARSEIILLGETHIVNFDNTRGTELSAVSFPYPSICSLNAATIAISVTLTGLSYGRPVVSRSNTINDLIRSSTHPSATGAIELNIHSSPRSRLTTLITLDGPRISRMDTRAMDLLQSSSIAVIYVLWLSASATRAKAQIVKECYSRICYAVASVFNKHFTTMPTTITRNIIASNLLMFLNKNKDQFTVNSQVHQYATRHQSDFHQPTTNLAKCQNGIGYMGVKVFNRLPINVKKDFDNSNRFRHSLMNFLREKSFYSLQEYFES